MHYIRHSTAGSYTQMLFDIKNAGRNVMVGEEMTTEIAPFTSRFLHPKRRLVNPPGRNLNYAFCIAEMLDIMMDDNPGCAPLYNKNILNWMDENGKFPGHYGERLDSGKLPHGVNMQGPVRGLPSQFQRCIWELQQRPTSRRATMTIHNPYLEDYNSKDVACTMDLQFLLRDGHLDCIAHMRSNDALWGFCYDTWLFQFLQESIAAILGVSIGVYYHFVGSLHYYHARHEQVFSIMARSNEEYLTGVPINIIWTTKEDWAANIRNLHNFAKNAPNFDTDILRKKWGMKDAVFGCPYFKALFTCLTAELARRKKARDLVEICYKSLPASSPEASWIKDRCKL